MSSVVVESFVCQRCAKCCMVSPISLLPHEALILTKLSEKLGINVEIEPGFTVVDIKNGIRIALSYVMKISDRCPFLDVDTKLCRIQELYKPLVCRCYPVVPSSIRYLIDVHTKSISHFAKYGISSLCPAVEKLRQYLTSDYSVPNVFPDEYEAQYIAEYLRMTYLHALTNMWREGVIELSPRSEGKEFPIVNAYNVVKPFIDVALLLAENRRYLPTIIECLSIKILKSVEQKASSL